MPAPIIGVNMPDPFHMSGMGAVPPRVLAPPKTNFWRNLLIFGLGTAFGYYFLGRSEARRASSRATSELYSRLSRTGALKRRGLPLGGTAERKRRKRKKRRRSRS